MGDSKDGCRVDVVSGCKNGYSCILDICIVDTCTITIRTTVHADIHLYIVAR